MKVLAGLGAMTSTGLPTSPQDPNGRLQDLKIQKIVESLLEKQPERRGRMERHDPPPGGVWLKEGELSRTMDRSTSYGPRMQRDSFGNIFYVQDEEGMGGKRMQQNSRCSADFGPRMSSTWSRMPGVEERCDPELRPKFAALQAQLC